MKLVVIESPFFNSDLTEHAANLSYARAAMRDSILRGEAPLAFHLLYTQDGILRDRETVERVLGITLSTFWWEAADLHVFYTDRSWSHGMLQALEWVRRHSARHEFRALNGVVQQPPPSDLSKRKIEEPRE